MADARRLYVSHYVQGHDVELIVHSRELGREMARQIRSDLRHLGLVSSGPQVRIACRQTAGVGDIIRATRNNHRMGVANGDVLRIEAVRADGTITVRRARDRDPETGQRTWTAGAAFAAGVRRGPPCRAGNGKQGEPAQGPPPGAGGHAGLGNRAAPPFPEPGGAGGSCHAIRDAPAAPGSVVKPDRYPHRSRRRSQRGGIQPRRAVAGLGGQ
jgi:hypothetical protein